MAWFVGVATVRLSDRHGRNGPHDKFCEIELETVDAGRVKISSRADNWRSALDAAFSRVGRALQRAWRRVRLGSRRLPEITSH